MKVLRKQAAGRLAPQLSRPWNFFGRNCPGLGLCVCVVFFAIPALGAKENASILSLEILVGQLTDLRLQISSEKRAWREQEPQWKRECSLLRIEKAQLEKELDGYQAEQGALTEDRAELLARKQVLSEASSKLERAVRIAEKDIHELYKLIPKPLTVNLKDAFEKMPTSDEAASRQHLTRRLQRVVALYAAVQKIQHEVRVVRSIIELDDSSREMDVIHLGLSQSFAVSSDDTVAAVGRLGKTGWVWFQNDDIALAVRKAVAVFNKEKLAELIYLPLQIEEMAE